MPLMHAAIASAHARDLVPLCDLEAKRPYWLTTQGGEAVTCRQCRRLAAIGLHRWDTAKRQWINK